MYTIVFIVLPYLKSSSKSLIRQVHRSFISMVQDQTWIIVKAVKFVEEKTTLDLYLCKFLS